ncbi:ATP-binding protein [Variovorax sp. IB41]|uniref:ATP-binding protein n=1 Tax=Variovorax sp. IB41 TaxID=2779370 RepID=UPI0018E6F824|nr:winged helix-turn-helix domain-containing protein [Variovorax sp. IB41]MBJ2154594.1 helix-turn-helix transcriptional regulator [Variovorax sp. IB41]
MQTDSKTLSDRALASQAGAVLAEVRWRFGPFVLHEMQRRLERGDELVRLGPRAFDLLLQLIKRAGEYIGKDELLATVWAGVVVEEASVRVHMSLLRKALGPLGESEKGEGREEWITNVPQRGYRFNVKVDREAMDTSNGIEARSPAPSFNRLPARLTELVGRESEVEKVLSSLESHQLVTLVGPGGIGKTSVAIHVAEHWQSRRGTPCAFVDLAPLISHDHVLGTIARALGAAADMPDTVQTITQFLQGQEVLLLIDNCEHVIESLALQVTLLLTTSPGLRVLATSRESLRVAAEYVVRLPPLAVPDADNILLPQAMQWPSVKLLVERARAAGAGSFDESHGSQLSMIARQVDGIPLAIELVAARLAVQSIHDLARTLNDHMRLFAIGKRAVAPRHKTLAAALDWSIALLDEEELRLLRRLSVFRGRFDVESAMAIYDDTASEAAFDALISLTNKSLISFDSNDAIAPYRLLDTTRAYAATLLARSDERPLLLKRHAMFMLDLMRAATSDLPDSTEQVWGERYAFRLDDVRFAFEVCLVEQPDVKIAASLVTASAPLWFYVSQVVEYGDKVRAALALVDQQPEQDMATAAWLATALVGALLHTVRPAHDLSAACDRALSGALAAKVRALELQARWAHCTYDVFRGEYAAAWKGAQALLGAVQTWDDPPALILAHRVSAITSHFRGDFEVSRLHSEASIAITGGLGRTRSSMFQVDAIVASNSVLCRTLWIQGDNLRALQMARDTMARAESLGNSVSLCAAGYGACAVALWSGETELARRWIQLMWEEGRRRGLLGWHRHAECFVLAMQLYDAPDPQRHIAEVLGQFGGYDKQRKETLVTFCPEWVEDEMVELVLQGESHWSASEVWRAAGLRSERHGAVKEAETFYLRAAKTSRQQGAMGWELRAVQNLARLWAGQGRMQEAIQLLDETCERTGPSGTGRDFNQARELRQKL